MLQDTQALTCVPVPPSHDESKSKGFASQGPAPENSQDEPKLTRRERRLNWRIRHNQAEKGGISPQYVQQFHKTKMCKYFLLNQCNRENNCTHAHSISELQETPDLSKTSLCKEFVTNGYCKRENCPFAHFKDELRCTDAVFKTKICKHNKKGKCRMGDTCRYAHTLEELQDAIRMYKTELTAASNSYGPHISLQLNEQLAQHTRQAGKGQKGGKNGKNKFNMKYVIPNILNMEELKTENLSFYKRYDNDQNQSSGHPSYSEDVMGRESIPLQLLPGIQAIPVLGNKDKKKHNRKLSQNSNNHNGHLDTQSTSPTENSSSGFTPRGMMQMHPMDWMPMSEYDTYAAGMQIPVLPVNYDGMMGSMTPGMMMSMTPMNYMCRGNSNDFSGFDFGMGYGDATPSGPMIMPQFMTGVSADDLAAMQNQVTHYEE